MGQREFFLPHARMAFKVVVNANVRVLSTNSRSLVLRAWPEVGAVIASAKGNLLIFIKLSLTKVSRRFPEREGF